MLMTGQLSKREIRNYCMNNIFRSGRQRLACSGRCAQLSASSKQQNELEKLTFYNKDYGI
jgi:hypothetical protein